MFDWISFLDQHDIEYFTSGPNTSKGNVATHCVFCGLDDQSAHMSISTEGRGWRCWRHPDHRGRNPTRLVQALLGCSWQHACELTNTNPTHVPEDFMSKVMAQLQPSPPLTNPSPALTLPNEFRKLQWSMPSARPFFRYLSRRQFPPRIAREQIYYCTRGAYKGRLIFPITYRKKVVTWTARTIYSSVELRYKTLSPNPDKAAAEGYAPAVGPITDYLMFHDELLLHSRVICICEGPMDAHKVRMLGRREGIVATALFTNTMSDQQVNLLHEILPRYDRRLLLLDVDTMPMALRIQEQLTGLAVKVVPMPRGLKDPAELSTPEQLFAVISLT